MDWEDNRGTGGQDGEESWKLGGPSGEAVMYDDGDIYISAEGREGKLLHRAFPAHGKVYLRLLFCAMAGIFQVEGVIRREEKQVAHRVAEEAVAPQRGRYGGNNKNEPPSLMLILVRGTIEARSIDDALKNVSCPALW